MFKTVNLLSSLVSCVVKRNFYDVDDADGEFQNHPFVLQPDSVAMRSWFHGDCLKISHINEPWSTYKANMILDSSFLSSTTPHVQIYANKSLQTDAMERRCLMSLRANIAHPPVKTVSCWHEKKKNVLKVDSQPRSSILSARHVYCWCALLLWTLFFTFFWKILLFCAEWEVKSMEEFLLKNSWGVWSSKLSHDDLSYLSDVLMDTELNWLKFLGKTFCLKDSKFELTDVLSRDDNCLKKSISDRQVHKLSNCLICLIAISGS